MQIYSNLGSAEFGDNLDLIDRGLYTIGAAVPFIVSGKMLKAGRAGLNNIDKIDNITFSIISFF